MDRLRRAPRADTAGFTLVELLVVMGVLGLLAAIVVPVMLTAQRAAYEASAKSDVKNIAKAISIHFVDGSPGALELTDEVTSKGRDWVLSTPAGELDRGTLSDHNTVSAQSFVAADGSYCLSVRNSKVGARFWSADGVGLSEGDCPP